ncbi:MAG: hypothetical protein ABIN67_01455 [Ferruginibacter sp.]
MRSVFTCIAVTIFLYSCNNNGKNPDVSGIQVSLTTERFEKNLFDTTQNNLASYLVKLQSVAPAFTTTFITKILNADPSWPTDSIAGYVNGFIHAYRPVYDTAEKLFSDFTKYEKEIKQGLQYVKHYFPEYKVPGKIITYIGPPDGYGDILTEDALVIGLQHHLGKDFHLYKTELVQQVYPEYISYNFEPDQISINCMKNIVNDLYLEKEDDKPMLNQMVEKGKRIYVLSKLQPEKEDYKLIGYTKKQMEECNDREVVIWNLFIKNSYLQVADKNIIKNYVGEGPSTPELGEGAPGNIGSYAGWQIVKKYMQKNAAISLQQLMNTDNEIIFQEAKYKP